MHPKDGSGSEDVESSDVESDEASPLDTAVLDTRYSAVEDRRADHRSIVIVATFESSAEQQEDPL